MYVATRNSGVFSYNTVGEPMGHFAALQDAKDEVVGIARGHDGHFFGNQIIFVATKADGVMRYELDGTYQGKFNFPTAPGDQPVAIAAPGRWHIVRADGLAAMSCNSRAMVKSLAA